MDTPDTGQPETPGGHQKPLTARTLDAFLWTFSAAGFQAILRIIVLAILARLLLPADFGVVGAALTVVALADLFDGRSQLLVYHFMFAPEWSQGCKSCSFLADNYEPSVLHLQHRDTTLVTVSRAPLDKLQAFRKRMGWNFTWVSSFKNDFNKDFGVYFTDEERNSGLSIYNYVSGPYPISDLPGLSVFTRDSAGNVFHTYSTYARGLDIFINTYNLLDVTPKGRDEEGMTNMDWLRHHDRYDDPNFVDPWLEKQATPTKA